MNGVIVDLRPITQLLNVVKHIAETPLFSHFSDS